MSNYSYKPLVSSDTRDYNSVFSYSKDKDSKFNSIYEDFSISLPTKHREPKQACFDCICTSIVKFFCYIAFILTLPFSLFVCLKLCHQYERFVIYRIGRLLPVKGPGLILVLPCIDTSKRIDIRTKAFNIPPTKLRTQDGCIISLGGVVHFSVQNPVLMTSSVQDMNHSVRVISQSAMTNLLCKKNVTDITNSHGRFNYDIQVDINQVAKDWGLDVSRVELSNVTIEFTPSAQQPSRSMPAMSAGMANPMDGGNAMESIAMLAQQFLSPQNNIATTSTPQLEPVGMKLMSRAEILDTVTRALSPDLVSEVNATYEIKLDDKNETFFLDLKNGSGDFGVGQLASGDPDVEFEMSFHTLQKFLAGSLKPYDAYWSGELKMSGDRHKALDIEKLVKCIKSVV